MDKAFYSDPTVEWVLPTLRDFTSVHHKLVGIWAEPVIDRGAVHCHSDFAGAAIWYPPATRFDEEAFFDVIRCCSRPDRIEAFFALVEACGKHRPTAPFWELELLAVDPVCQGQGIGSALLEHGLQACVDKTMPVYLESSNPANLSLYRRFGFELLAEVQLPGTPKRFPMLRKAH